MNEEGIMKWHFLALPGFLFLSALAGAGSLQAMEAERVESTEEKVDVVTAESILQGLAIQNMGWAEPDFKKAEESQILSEYSHVDPLRLVPTKLLKDVLLYFHRNKQLIANQNYVSVVDFAEHSRDPRFYRIDLKTGEVKTVNVSHGRGSDKKNLGRATRFSNVRESHMSSLGFYLTAEPYFGVHGLSLRLDGLSQTNSNVRSRAIVIHGADYVTDAKVKQGRSLGCFVFSWTMRDELIPQLKEGSLILAATATAGPRPAM